MKSVVAPLSVDEISELLKGNYGDLIKRLDSYNKRRDNLWSNKKYQNILDDVIDNDGEFSEESEELWMDEQHIGGESLTLKLYLKKPDDKRLKELISELIGDYDDTYTPLGIEYLKKNFKKEEFDNINGLNLQERALKTPKQLWIDAIDKENAYLAPLKKAPDPDWYFNGDKPSNTLLEYRKTYKIPISKNTANSLKKILIDNFDEDIKFFTDYLIKHGIFVMRGSIMPTPSTLGWLLNCKSNLLDDKLDDLVDSREGITYRLVKKGSYYYMSFFSVKGFNEFETNQMLDKWRINCESLGATELTPVIVLNENSNVEKEVREYCDNLKLND